MIKKLFLCLSVCGISMLTYAEPAHQSPANLIDVYNSALKNDPIYQQAISTDLSTREGVPISVAALLPQIGLTETPAITKSTYSGPAVRSGSSPNNNTLKANTLTLTINQTVFDFGKFAIVAGSLSTAKGADATLNAALQNLMIRVSTAYFNVLKDEETLSYSLATKKAFAEQLDQVKQQYDVGLKTITDVYTAESSYDQSSADYIAAETTLQNDKENLRVITGHYYPHLAKLDDNFPLISPFPSNVESWVAKATAQNWSIKSARYAVDTARHNIHQQFAGHLPTLNVTGTFDRIYNRNINSDTSTNIGQNGASTETDKGIALTLAVPIFSGGGVTANTNQATYQYQTSEGALDQAVKDTINTTRKSYLGVISGISKVNADKQTIKSSISSLNGMEESYRVGTETLVDVLNQRQKVFEAQTNYAADRYAYITSLLALKEAAGTLSFNDLRALSAWLRDHHDPSPSIKKIAAKQSVQKKMPAKKEAMKKPIAKKIAVKKSIIKKPTHQKHITAKSMRPAIHAKKHGTDHQHRVSKKAHA